MKHTLNWILPTLMLATWLSLPTPTSAQQNTSLVSHLSLGADDRTADVWADGNYAYVARLELGLDIVDVSNPQSPSVVTTILPFAHVQVRDVQVHNNIAYIGNYVPNGSPTPHVGMFIYDVSIPSAPVELGRIEWGAGAWYHLGASTYNIEINPTQNGTFAYLASRITSAIEVFDVSAPATPIWVSTIMPPLTQYGTIPGHSYDMRVDNGLCYGAWDTGGFTIHDVSNPAAPVFKAHHTYPGAYTHNAWPTDDGLHLCTTDFISGGHLKIWDISDLNNITPAGTFSSPNGAIVHKVMVDGDYAYMSFWEDGLRVADISDRNNPVSVAWFDPDPGAGLGTADGVWGVYPAQNNIYLSHRTEGLYIVEIVPEPDTVEVLVANWFKKTKIMIVEATSTAAPLATLTVDGFGQMTYNANSGRYEVSISGVSRKPRSVTVTSDLGGSDSKRVRSRK